MEFTCDEFMQVVYIMIWSSFSFFLLVACDSLWRCSTPVCFCFFSMSLSNCSHMQSCLWYQFLTPNFTGQIMLIWMLWVSMVMMNWMILIKRSKAYQKEQLKAVRRQIQKVWICRVSLSIQLITCWNFRVPKSFWLTKLINQLKSFLYVYYISLKLLSKWLKIWCCLQKKLRRSKSHLSKKR